MFLFALTCHLALNLASAYGSMQVDCEGLLDGLGNFFVGYAASLGRRKMAQSTLGCRSSQRTKPSVNRSTRGYCSTGTWRNPAIHYDTVEGGLLGIVPCV